MPPIGAGTGHPGWLAKNGGTGILGPMQTQRKTPTTALVLIPPLEVWEPIQRIRRRFDRQFRRWMPHITMLYPFRPATQFDQVASILGPVCRAARPLEIELRTFHRFAHAHSFTMWLAPEPAEPIRRLQARLLACVPECNDVCLHEGGFTPHLSVGQARSAEELEARLSELRSTFQPMRFVISDVALIRRGRSPDSRFEVDRLLPLGR